MERFISAMPAWSNALFVISFLLSIAFIANPAKQAAIDAGLSRRKATTIQIGIFVFYFVYLAYVSVLSLNGAFVALSILPRAMPYAGIPLMILLFGVIGNTRLFNRLLRSISLESLIRIHVFRLVGVFFLLLYAFRQLPPEFALPAGLGDIATALLAIPVARIAAKQKPYYKTAVYAWNIFGALDIANLVRIAVMTTINTINTGVDGRLQEMTFFPFSWFPAFAPATIFFLHFVVFRKLYQVQKAGNLLPAVQVDGYR